MHKKSHVLVVCMLLLAGLIQADPVRQVSDDIGMTAMGQLAPEGLINLAAAIAQARSVPARVITIGHGVPHSLWLALDDPDAVAVTEQAVQTGGAISIRLIALQGESPAKAALFYRLLEQTKPTLLSLPGLVHHFHATDLISLLTQYAALPACAQQAAKLRVDADSSEATRLLGRLDLTVFDPIPSRMSIAKGE